MSEKLVTSSYEASGWLYLGVILWAHAPLPGLPIPLEIGS